MNCRYSRLENSRTLTSERTYAVRPAYISAKSCGPAIPSLIDLCYRDERRRRTGRRVGCIEAAATYRSSTQPHSVTRSFFSFHVVQGGGNAIASSKKIDLRHRCVGQLVMGCGQTALGSRVRVNFMFFLTGHVF